MFQFFIYELCDFIVFFWDDFVDNYFNEWEVLFLEQCYVYNQVVNGMFNFFFYYYDYSCIEYFGYISVGEVYYVVYIWVAGFFINYDIKIRFQFVGSGVNGLWVIIIFWISKVSFGSVLFENNWVVVFWYKFEVNYLGKEDCIFIGCFFINCKVLLANWFVIVGVVVYFL